MSKLRLAIVEVTASEPTELEALAKRRKTAQALALSRQDCALLCVWPAQQGGCGAAGH